MNNIPEFDVPVLAKMSKGLITWFDVLVFCKGNIWKYQFDLSHLTNNESIIDWVYCENSFIFDAEQLQVQLAGCSVAALGGTKDVAVQGMYGWSPAYQDVLELRIKYDKNLGLKDE